jgi:hypothetical protein
MSNFFSFRCPACNARIKAPPQLAGRTRPCPGCGRPVVVRRPVPQPSGPVLVGQSNHGTPAPRPRTG